MRKFAAEQKVYRIGNVELGGQPGERPTVLIGSIFFSGHRIVHDPQKGVFDKGKAKALLEREAEVALRTGNPRFIDVIGETAQALINYIEFVAAHASDPILVDSPVQEARIGAIRHFAGTEVAPRLIYNSIAEDYSEEELACIKECGVRSAVILAFSKRALKPTARVELLEESLLPAAERAGVENILVDPGVLDIPSISWSALAIREIKEKLGYPSGCAPSNALYMWEKMKGQGTPAFEAAGAAVFALTQALGADFIFYGPVRNAPWAYASVAAMDAMIAYAGRFTGIRPQTETHPLYRIF